MPNKLRYHIKNKKKVYTLKTQVENKETKSAHYKFVKIKDAPKTGFKSK